MESSDVTRSVLKVHFAARGEARKAFPQFTYAIALVHPYFFASASNMPFSFNAIAS